MASSPSPSPPPALPPPVDVNAMMEKAGKQASQKIRRIRSENPTILGGYVGDDESVERKTLLGS